MYVCKLTPLPTLPTPLHSTRVCMSVCLSLQQTQTSSAAPTERRTTILPEVEAYLMLVVLARLLENKTNAALSLKVAEALLALCHEHNRRTLELLRARAWHYFARCHELSGNSREVSVLMSCHFVSCPAADPVLLVGACVCW
jgi:hypothetical protein